jgi:hypothetical protein
MIPSLWLKAAPWIIAGVMALAAAMAGKMYLSERDEFTEFRAEVKTLGEAAELEKIDIETERKANLEKVKEYERNLPAIRNAAVAAYRLRYPNASCSTMPVTSDGIKMDDGASKESMDAEFIKNCSDDAAKLEAWREYGILNKLPIK